jgi:hypothetical protein
MRYPSRVPCAEGDSFKDPGLPGGYIETGAAVTPAKVYVER